jgi:hypothetical protein
MTDGLMKRVEHSAMEYLAAASEPVGVDEVWEHVYSLFSDELDAYGEASVRRDGKRRIAALFKQAVEDEALTSDQPMLPGMPLPRFSLSVEVDGKPKWITFLKAKWSHWTSHLKVTWRNIERAMAKHSQDVRWSDRLRPYMEHEPERTTEEAIRRIATEEDDRDAA